MGISRRGLVRAVSRGVAAYQQGRREGEERRVAAAEAAEDRERRARLGMLQEQLTQSQIEDRRTTQAGAQDRARQIRESATRLRQQYPKLAHLPDEELVEAVKSIQTRPPREGASSRARQDLVSVEKQVDDTRSDLARAEREVRERPAFFISKEAEAAFDRSQADVRRRVGELQQRADSLGGVRDQLAAEVQGRRAPVRTPEPPPTTEPSPPQRGGGVRLFDDLPGVSGRRAPDDVLQGLARRFNWDEAKIRQELIRLGYDPDA